VVVGLVEGVPEDGPEIAARWQRAIVLAKAVSLKESMRKEGKNFGL